MAKDKITEYDATANNNTVCGDVNIAENSALPSDMNNFAREIMSHLKEGLGSGTPLYVDQTNNRVGIGNSSPDVPLEISVAGSSITNVLKLTTTGSGTVPALQFEGDASGTQHIVGRIRGQQDDANDGGLVFETESSGTVAERMRITSAGNVGIGTTSPDDKLHVADSSNAELKLQTDNANGGSVVKFNRSGTDNSYIGTKGYFLGNSDNNLYLRANSGLGIEFYTNGNNERMRIDSSGALFINRTSTYSYANGSLCVEGTGGNPCIVAGTSGTSFYNNVVIGNGNGNVGSISTNGSSTAYNTSSDYRLKENVVSDWDATTRLKQLNPVRFNFIADADTTVDGFLAHEVQSVVPEAISGTHNEVDADGNAVMQGIDQSKLVPLLTGALKEAIAKIEDLEARIVALETA